MSTASYPKALRISVVASVRRRSERVFEHSGPVFLLLSGAKIIVAGALAAGITFFVFGGIGPNGAHGIASWLALIAALMCLPLGVLRCLLGVAAWLRARPRGFRSF